MICLVPTNSTQVKNLFFCSPPLQVKGSQMHIAYIDFVHNIHGRVCSCSIMCVCGEEEEFDIPA